MNPPDRPAGHYPRAGVGERPGRAKLLSRLVQCAAEALVTDAAIKELGMRLPYSPPLIVPLSSGSSSGSSGNMDATSSGDADASITTSQGPTGSGDV